MTTYFFENATSTLQLNEGVTSGVGIQASNISGLGLPPVDVRWYDLNEGSRYHYTRALSREYDVTLDIRGSTRADLLTRLGVLTALLSAPFTFGCVDDAGTTWKTTVARVGGGEVSTSDIGEMDVQLVLTLRAGDPYWTRSTSTMVNIVSPFGAATMTNIGDAETYPVWTFYGPFTGWCAAVELGGVGPRYVQWSGSRLVNERIVIDMGAGTVTKYTAAGVASNGIPDSLLLRFFSLPTGVNSQSATFGGGTSGSTHAEVVWYPRKKVVL